MLDEIESGDQFVILAQQTPALEEDIAVLASHFRSCPLDYTMLVRQATEIELQHRSGQYLRIWGPPGCLEMDEGYGIRERIPGAFPFGDDGGGHILFFANGHQGRGIYHVGYGNLDLDDAIWVAPNLRSLLVDGEGIAAF